MLMTVKDHAASMSCVNVGYQTEVIRLWKSMCTSLTKPPYYEEDQIRLICRVPSIEQKKDMSIWGSNKMPSEEKVVWMFEIFFR